MVSSVSKSELRCLAFIRERRPAEGEEGWPGEERCHLQTKWEAPSSVGGGPAFILVSYPLPGNWQNHHKRTSSGVPLREAAVIYAPTTLCILILLIALTTLYCNYLFMNLSLSLDCELLKGRDCFHCLSVLGT